MLFRFLGLVTLTALVVGSLSAAEFKGAVRSYSVKDGVVTLLVPEGGELRKELAKVVKYTKITQDGKKVSVEDFEKMVKKAANPKDKGLKVKVTTKKADDPKNIEIATAIEIAKPKKAADK